MDAIELVELDAAFGELFNVMAGDTLMAIAVDGSQAEFTTLRWEPDTERSSGFEGLAIGPAGIEDQQERDVLILKSHLEAAAWDLDATQHFLINGERWDFADKKPIRRDLAPLGGWQGLIMITIRKAVELNESAAGSTFTYGT